MLLEDDVTDLQDEVEEMETDISQLDDGLLLVEGIAVENSNDIVGKSILENDQEFMIMKMYSHNLFSSMVCIDSFTFIFD